MGVASTLFLYSAFLAFAPEAGGEPHQATGVKVGAVTPDSALTPLVGPDRASKKDNHSNVTFAHEGEEIRGWFRDQGLANLFVVCGDRHWQYHSVHPETGLHEFACGPASDQHAGGSPGFTPEYHRFHRVKGGFLTVTVEPEGESAVTFRHHDVHGKVVHEYRQEKDARRSADR